MQGMNSESSDETQRATRNITIVVCGLLLLILAVGAFLRLKGLDTKSLWLDEFSTWHVSRMPFGESMRWGPELTKPPLYQLCLRAITSDPHPSEFLLRLPAAVCGILTIAAGYWLACGASGRRMALAFAALLACNAMQIEYSQEARPYSMMVLGCTLSIAMWHRLITTSRLRYLCGFVIVTTLSFHAHYLTLMTVLAEVAWWLIVRKRNLPDNRKPLAPIALVVTGLLCTPIVLHYLANRSSVFQGLGWIAQPTWHTALDVLQELTIGPFWVLGMIFPAIAVWFANRHGRFLPKTPPTNGEPILIDQDLCILLICWLGSAWFGLQVISWFAHPAMVVRYAIPAAIPALLIPLLVMHRLDRRAPLIAATIFVLTSAPGWIEQASEYDPGVRELVAFVQENIDPDREGVVLTIDNRTYPGWEDMERLALEYYPFDGIEVQELHLGPDGVTPITRLLEEDPRALYLIALWADPFAILETAGRTSEQIQIDGQSFSRLLFTPYRLVRVAPVTPS